MKKPYKLTTHHLLAISYLVYFFCIAGGIGLSIFFPLRVRIPGDQIFAAICFVGGPLLILWAQYSSYMFERGKKDKGEISFYVGPYKMLRNPTQLGLFLLIFGYVFILHSVTLLLAILFSYVVGNYFYKKQEALLEHKYGKKYQEYEKEVEKVL
ncbi:MAG: methyltransferase [bacterium]